MWEAKPFKAIKTEVVPKHFYRNYRKSMVSQADEIARTLMNQTKDLIHMCVDCPKCRCPDFIPPELSKKIGKVSRDLKRERAR